MRPSTLSLQLPVLALVFASTIPAFAGEVKALGLPNFHQVNENIYRGAQPTNEGWDSLAKLGIKVVIDLRRENENNEHSIAAEEKAVQAAGMRYVSIPMNGLAAPSGAQISKVMALFDSGERVFVHCRRGKDRTGTVIACYRIARDRWDNKKALTEAKSIGLHWIELGMKRYISGYKPPVATATIAAPTPATATANQ